MKKIKLFFTVILFACLFGATFADDASDIARAAKRTGATGAPTAISARAKSDNTNSVNSSILSRAAPGATKPETIGTRSAINIRDNGVISAPEKSRVARDITSPAISARSATGIPRTATSTARVSVGTAPIARTTINNTTRTQSARSAINNIAPQIISSPGIARNAISASDKKAAPDYKKCRDVFYGCMDEFCAAKDTQLKRCACSIRMNDFNNTKKKLDRVEDKLLTFNERLLTVNMDASDAAAISIATAGETAYQSDDKSASKKILDEIAGKLKKSNADSSFDRNLSAISLSLDMDSAFDNIDSMMGSGTSTKSGPELYSAALPICRDMVAEVCDAEGAAIAESGYQMAIEQDCNTVSKAYDNMTDGALTKLREGSALLDMSRLDTHQKRNSDDILTCKKKMLDTMSSASVCGTDLGRCLDITGKYIDPSTGAPFLTLDLVNLGSVLTRPDSGGKWTNAPGNNSFVLFLNSKKTYLEPAMENCVDISDAVWNDFIEDALAQIKLAQEKKLEDMRTGCTALTTQCLSDTAKSISQFDARALSIFGVTADKTVNEMCAGIKTACTAILKTSNTDGGDWVGGMSEIETDKTYETILQTCREIGKACIIQTCKSTSGNFGLCENIERSVNRKSIIRRSACWNDVVKCVGDAGTNSITNIMTRLQKTPGASGGDFYTENYGDDYIRTNKATCDALDTNSDGTPIHDHDNCVYDICTRCGTSGAPDCSSCRLAEKIWGNCEFPEATKLKENTQNKIKIPTSGETLLSWFADNTGTTNSFNSCMDTTCPAGYTAKYEKEITRCVSDLHLASDDSECGPHSEERFQITNTFSSCCFTTRDSFNNCCETENTLSINSINICKPNTGIAKHVTNYKDDLTPTIERNMICTGTVSATGNDIDSDAAFPNDETVECTNGKYVVINPDTGIYTSMKYTAKGTNDNGPTQTPTYPANYYNQSKDLKCTYNTDTGGWGTGDTWTPNAGCKEITDAPNKDNDLFIEY